MGDSKDKSKAPPKEKENKKRTPQNDAALHVIKGAIVKVLGPAAAVTTGVEFSSKTKAIIHIAYEKEKTALTEEEKDRIQSLANEIIQQDVELKEFKMKRSEAETKYKQNPVNDTFIYDNFPVPESIKELNIVQIDDWNVNCCLGPHCKRTGEIQAIRLLKVKYNKAKPGVPAVEGRKAVPERKAELEFLFDIGPAALTGLEAKKGGKKVDRRPKAQSSTSSSSSSSSTSSSTSTTSSSPSSDSFDPLPLLPIPTVSPSSLTGTSLVKITRDEIINEVINFLNDSKTRKLLVEGKLGSLPQEVLTPKIESLLRSLENVAYGEGFQSRPSSNVPKPHF